MIAAHRPVTRAVHASAPGGSDEPGIAGAGRSGAPPESGHRDGNSQEITDRAAGAILAFEGLFLLVPAAGAVAEALPGLGSRGTRWKRGFGMAGSAFGAAGVGRSVC